MCKHVNFCYKMHRVLEQMS